MYFIIIAKVFLFLSSSSLLSLPLQFALMTSSRISVLDKISLPKSSIFPGHSGISWKITRILPAPPVPQISSFLTYIHPAASQFISFLWHCCFYSECCSSPGYQGVSPLPSMVPFFFSVIILKLYWRICRIKFTHPFCSHCHHPKIAPNLLSELPHWSYILTFPSSSPFCTLLSDVIVLPFPLFIYCTNICWVMYYPGVGYNFV